MNEKIGLLAKCFSLGKVMFAVFYFYGIAFYYYKNNHLISYMYMFKKYE